jgi:F-type H+-transporting ATPase subunit b
MTLIFLVLLFIVVKFGFPVITDSVEKRTSRIDQSIRDAKAAEEKLRNLAKEQEKMIADTKLEQSKILKEAADARAKILEQARADAQSEADKMIAKAKTEIAAEKESALLDVRKEMAMLSVQVAEKIVRKDLSSSEAQTEYVNKLVDELSAGEGKKDKATDAN